MKQICMAMVICAAICVAAAGCHSSSSGTGDPGTITEDGTVVRANQVPVAVMSAFDTEYPYAKMTQVAQKDAGNGTSNFTIEFVRSDGSTGKVIYAQSGAMISGGN